MIDLVVVIPVYNESATINLVVNDWVTTLDKLDINYKIKIYDDGSTDTTKKVLENLNSNNNNLDVIFKENEGHGPTILKAYKKNLNSKWIFQVDSDDEISASHFIDFWSQRHNYDIVIGKRKGRNGSAFRKIMSYFSFIIVCTFFGRGIKDVNSPYRLMRVSSFKEIINNIPSNTFAPNIIISGMANKSKMKIKQLDVIYKVRENSISSLSENIPKLMRISINCFKQIIIYGFKH